MLVSVSLSGGGGMLDTRRIEIPDVEQIEGQAKQVPNSLEVTALAIELLTDVPLGPGDTISITEVVQR